MARSSHLPLAREGRPQIGLGILLQLAVLAGQSAADELVLSRIRWDEGWSVLRTDIGLAPGAEVAIEIQTKLHRNDTYAFLLSDEQYYALRTARTMEQKLKALIPFRYHASIWRAELNRDVKAAFQVTAPKADRYTICTYAAQKAPVNSRDRLRGKLTFVNPGGQHLMVQDAKVPLVLLFFAILCTTCSSMYCLLLMTLWHRRRSRLHSVMLFVMTMRGVALLARWHSLQQVVRYGWSTQPLGTLSWDFLDKVQEVSQLVLFMLVALGWQYLRAALNFTEVRFVAGTSIISLYLGTFEVYAAVENPLAKKWYEIGRQCLHFLCYLVVVVAMNYNLQMLVAQIADWPARMEVGKLYRKLNAYIVFRLAFLAFLAGEVVENVVGLLIPWEQATCTVKLLHELRLFVIYISLMVAFRPSSASLRVFDMTVQPEGGDEEDGQDDDDDIVAGSELEMTGS
mmetsp:Transcript_53787/g.99426  ORF Transcript_53787/g.99426 Transcript_53787/m.99426 type:complete len:455 (-) Transcript_53787:50-1414(-)